MADENYMPLMYLTKILNYKKYRHIKKVYLMKSMRILYILPEQFGYFAGYYYYCKHLLEAGHHVTVLCLDSNLKKIDINHENFKIIYYSRNVKKDDKLTKKSLSFSCILWRLSFFFNYIKLKKNNDIIIFKYYPGVSAMALLRRKGVFLDIRTGTIACNKVRRIFYDLLLTIEDKFFKQRLILSTELAKQLKISKSSMTYLPLGADISTDISKKSYIDNLSLLYIGTLTNRNITQTVEGFADFYKKNYNQLPISYDIIGFGSELAEKELLNTIQKTGMINIVHFHGRKNYTELQPFWDRCNCGVAYVPQTPFFDLQPPTKVFEYTLNGLICLATSTSANIKLITNKNGLLHNDTPESFTKCLEALLKSRSNFTATEIQCSHIDYNWASIVSKILIPAFCHSISKDNIDD